jgi:1,5-anhydro-D-fructose reductase (1,5-anhydro-D-mannitol-forming)
MENVNWGIIGCGNVCEKKSGPAFYKINHSALIAIMRRDESKGLDYIQRHNVPKFYLNADELINDPEINAIYIATPPNNHKEYVIKALQAGKPVYVEKPMAMNHHECLKMIQASEDAKQKLFVAYYRRALPYFLKVKDILDSRTIGDILTVEIKHYKRPRLQDINKDDHTWHLDRRIAGEGYFYDLASHTLDILDFLLGEIEDAKGYAQNLGKLYEVKDTISAAFQFKSGVIGTGQWCFVTSLYSEQDEIKIVGTKGEVAFSTFSFTPIKLISESLSEEYDIAPPEHIQQPLIQTIVDELRGVGQSPSTGISAARTSKVMDWILNGNI